MIETALRDDSAMTKGKRAIVQPQPDLGTIILGKLKGDEPITLRRLVSRVSSDSAQSADRVVAEIVRLQGEGRLSVTEPKPYRTLPGYLFSPYSIWFWEVVLGALSSLGVVLISSGPFLYVRIVLGGLLVLFLPGYSIVNAIYPKKTEIDSLTTVALSFVMSVATVALIGFVLNYTPFGISLGAVAVCIGVMTLALTFLAAVRKYASYKLTMGLDPVSR